MGKEGACRPPGFLSRSSSPAMLSSELVRPLGCTERHACMFNRGRRDGQAGCRGEGTNGNLWREGRRSLLSWIHETVDRQSVKAARSLKVTMWSL